MAPIRLPMFSFGTVECTGEWACRCEGDEVPLFTGKCGSSPTGKTTSRVCGCSAGSSSCPAAPRSGRSNGRSACRWFRSSARRSFTVRPGRPDSSRHSRAGRGGRRRRASWTTPAPCPPSASRSPASEGCSKSCQIRYEGHRRGPPATAPKKCRPSPPLVRSSGSSSPSPSPGGKSPPASLPARAAPTSAARGRAVPSTAGSPTTHTPRPTSATAPRLTLKRRHVQDPPELGIRVQDAFPAIVSSGDFLPAQEIILARARRFTDDERLDRLRQILPQPGRPSGALIDENENENLPSGAGLRHRFGRPACAHRLIG